MNEGWLDHWHATPYGQPRALTKDLCENIPKIENELIEEIEFFWQELVDLGTECCPFTGNLVGCVRLSPETAALRLWKLLQERAQGKKALLEPIARQARCPSLSQAIDAVAGNLRRQLQRRRQLLSLQKITEFDHHCLHWYLRQPGTTMEEKAGARQRLMGLERHESHNTLENRVFRDFLRHSVEAAVDYHRNFPDSQHCVDVLAHRNRCQTLLRGEIIGKLPRLATPPLPNYILQYERNYHTIWDNYWDLILHRQRKDDLIRWRHRLWRDAAAWALLVAIFRLEEFHAIACDAVYVLRQQLQGRWTEFPPLILHGEWRLPPTPEDGAALPIDHLRAQRRRRAKLTLWDTWDGAALPNLAPARDSGADFLLEVAADGRRRWISLWCAHDGDLENSSALEHAGLPENSLPLGLILRPGRSFAVCHPTVTLPIPLTLQDAERWHGEFAKILEASLR
ncbi:MAG: DUF2357 domain-containing protein [Puniceicoccales bacterium]|jgi:hypothetical protein|nr:DUF2357 domain-containing protein [Puniceicoccales bacterium]